MGLSVTDDHKERILKKKKKKRTPPMFVSTLESQRLQMYGCKGVGGGERDLGFALLFLALPENGFITIIIASCLEAGGKAGYECFNL